MMSAQYAGVTRQIVKIIHNDGNKQIQHLQWRRKGMLTLCVWNSIEKTKQKKSYQKWTKEDEWHKISVGHRRATIFVAGFHCQWLTRCRQACEHNAVPCFTGRTTVNSIDKHRNFQGEKKNDFYNRVLPKQEHQSAKESFKIIMSTNFCIWILFYISENLKYSQWKIGWVQIERAETNEITGAIQISHLHSNHRINEE